MRNITFLWHHTSLYRLVFRFHRKHFACHATSKLSSPPISSRLSMSEATTSTSNSHVLCRSTSSSSHRSLQSPTTTTSSTDLCHRTKIKCADDRTTKQARLLNIRAPGDVVVVPSLTGARVLEEAAAAAAPVARTGRAGPGAATRQAAPSPVRLASCAISIRFCSDSFAN